MVFDNPPVGIKIAQKVLSKKILINKEKLDFLNWILEIWIFNFWVVKWLKGLIFKGFDDKGYDKGFDEWNDEIWLKNKGVGGGGFLSWCVDELAIHNY